MAEKATAESLIPKFKVERLLNQGWHISRLLPYLTYLPTAPNQPSPVRMEYPSIWIEKDTREDQKLEPWG